MKKNLDRIARILSSNCCEQYFGCLVKYSQGKRLNQDMTDSWRVLQYFVAGLRSNANFTSDLIEHIGLVPSHIRNEMKLKIKKNKEYQSKYHKEEKQIHRRKCTKAVRDHLMGKEESKKGKHKTDKMKPTVSAKKKTQRKKAVKNVETVVELVITQVSV